MGGPLRSKRTTKRRNQGPGRELLAGRGIGLDNTNSPALVVVVAVARYLATIRLAAVARSILVLEPGLS